MAPPIDPVPPAESGSILHYLWVTFILPLWWSLSKTNRTQKHIDDLIDDATDTKVHIAKLSGACEHIKDTVDKMDESITRLHERLDK